MGRRNSPLFEPEPCARDYARYQEMRNALITQGMRPVFFQTGELTQEPDPEDSLSIRRSV